MKPRLKSELLSFIILLYNNYLNFSLVGWFLMELSTLYIALFSFFGAVIRGWIGLPLRLQSSLMYGFTACNIILMSGIGKKICELEA